MSRSKQNKTSKKDGNHRAETKEERQVRLMQQAEAREACFKLLPMVGGVMILLMIIFSMYVRSVPPKVPTPKTSPAPNMDVQRILEEAMKEGKMNIKDPAEGAEVPMGEAPAPGEGGETQSEPNEEHVEL